MIPDALISALKENRVILFVGAGVSMNLGLPSFRQLVSHIGARISGSTRPFFTL
jgi:NAD-dependent SIR2 family protein deacetylase